MKTPVGIHLIGCEIMKRGKKGIGNIVGVLGLGDLAERETLNNIGSMWGERGGFIFKINFYWSIVGVQCCVKFCSIAQ